MWYLRLLGTISAERDGQTVSLAPRKYTSLFAFLALHPGRSFSRDELADRFWPNSDIERGRGALRTALSTLRKTFGPDVLPEGGDVVSLRPTLLSTDVERFVVVLREARATQDAAAERQLLREALVLYTGPLLPALYDDWLLEKRDALARQRDEALERERVLTEMAERAARSQPHPPKTIGAQLVTLPRFASRFLGRVAERETLKALLLRPEVRLVTLTGLGGMGKTRLALETVSSLTGRFTGAVAFVPLADCPDGASLFPFWHRHYRLQWRRVPGNRAAKCCAVLRSGDHRC